MKKFNFWFQYMIHVAIAFIIIAILSLMGMFIIKKINKTNAVYAASTKSVIYLTDDDEPIYLYIEKIEETKHDDTQEENRTVEENTVFEEEEQEVNEEPQYRYDDITENESNQLDSYYISGVPYINQYNLGYPMGCEAVSATMAAKYAGYNISTEKIIAKTPTDLLGKRQETKTIEETVENENGELEKVKREELVWVGENPFKYFVGSPSKTAEEGAYGCFAEPITIALKKLNVKCTNISGCEIGTVYDYIKSGKPVIIWCRARARDLNEGVVWQYPDGSGDFTELVGEHCSVLIGYDENYIYLNDPAIGEGVSQPRKKFEENWYKLYSQAIVID